MSFNIQNFKSVLDQNDGLVRISHFKIEVPTPRGMKNVSAAQVPTTGNSTIDTILNTYDYYTGGVHPYGTYLLPFYCSSAILPGLGILTSDIYRYGYGAIQRKPYGVVFNDMMCSMYLDGKGNIKNWFNNWTSLIINTNTSKGINSKAKISGAYAYEFGYLEDYAVDLNVIGYTPEGKEAVVITLTEAYPNFIGDIQLDWRAKNTNALMQVSFTYKDWFPLRPSNTTSAIDALNSVRNVLSLIR